MSLAGSQVSYPSLPPTLGTDQGSGMWQENVLKSTWYKENKTGQGVSIILTEEGERLIRTRLGLACPTEAEAQGGAGAMEVASNDTLAPASPLRPDSVSRKRSADTAAFIVSPNAKQALMSALVGAASSSSSSSGAGEIQLPTTAMDKLADALEKYKRSRQQ